MAQVSYIHAADLHLDAPFQGLSKQFLSGERLAKELRASTFQALDRLEKFCLEQKPDFLLLAGDLTNCEEQSIRARLRIVRLCEDLNQAGIQVFIIHGNHDPKASAFKSITLPPNVTVFDQEVSQKAVVKDGQTIAIIHGVSHGERGDNRNTAQAFKRDRQFDQALQIGLLHTALANYSNQDDNQPCTLRDLKQANLDAWALGHVHKAAIISEANPLIVYAGSPQGLDISEAGDHGCYLVVASKESENWEFNLTFKPLATVVLRKLALDISGLTKLDEVLRLIYEALEAMRLELNPSSRIAIVEITLKGSTILERELALGLKELEEELAQAQTGLPEIYVSRLVLATKPLVNLEEYLKRDDLLGYCLQQAKNLSLDDQAAKDFIYETLSPLFSHSQLRKILPPLSTYDLNSLLQEAAKLCISKLEDQRVY